jgi:glycine/sarcosine N-methyltransferase
VTPANKNTQDQPRSVPEFYDLLAPHYDSMTGFEKRFVQEKPFFRLLVERYGIKSALDAGCGSGFHSLLLSQLGVKVTAVDLSAEMLRLTQEHARRYDVRVRILKGSFQELGTLIKDRFDAVFVMGNSLAHLLSLAELTKSLLSLSSLVTPEGIFFSQSLNYERILATKERVQSTKDAGDRSFVRFYEYDEQGIIFNIITRQNVSGAVEEKVETIRLRPVLRDEFVKVLQQSGFEDIEVFGGISMEPYDAGTSKDLVVRARRRN